MKKNFITGLALLLPFSVTLWIIIFVVDFLTNPFLELSKEAAHQFHVLRDGQLIIFIRIIILFCLAGLILLTGFFAQVLLLRYMFSIGDSLLHRIPLVNRLYKPLQEIVQILLNEEKTKFSKVGLVPFPHEKAYAFGLISSDKMPEGSDPTFQDRISLFVVGAPNPMMGFMLLYDRSKVIFLDVTVEQTMKYLVSCGSVPLKFKQEP